MIPALMDASRAAAVAAVAHVPCGGPSAIVRIDVESCGSSTWPRVWRHDIPCDDVGKGDIYDGYDENLMPERRKLHDSSSPAGE